MDEIFKQLAKVPPPKMKVHTVNIQGVEVEVSLQKKLEIQRAGEYSFILKDGEIVPKPRKKVKLTCPQLVKAVVGGHFCDGDPHWIIKVDKEGYQWQIKSE